MSRIAIAFAGVLVALFMCDFTWLSISGPLVYTPNLGDLLLESPLLFPAFLFYVVYAAGVTFLIVLPALAAGRVASAVLRGAVLGFVAYATYDLTNLATLKGWSVTVVLADIAWGTVLTGTASGVGTWLAARFGGAKASGRSSVGVVG